MSQQGLRQASVRGVTGTALTYEGDWSALFDQSGVAAGEFNGRLLAWINSRLGTSYTEINGAMAAYAASQGAPTWSGMGTFTPGPAPASFDFYAAPVAQGNGDGLSPANAATLQTAATLAAAASSGGARTVGLLPGTYGPTTLDCLAAAAGVTFRPTGAVHSARWERVNLRQATNVTVRDVRITSIDATRALAFGSASSTGAPFVVNNVVIDGCSVEGAYRGELGRNINPALEYPEYYSIVAPVNNGSFVIEANPQTVNSLVPALRGKTYVGAPPDRPADGPYIPDGVHDIVPTDAAGTGTGFQGEVTVSGGHITSINVINAGTGYGPTSGPNAGKILSGTAVATMKIRRRDNSQVMPWMTESLPYGIGALSFVDMLGLTVRNCTFVNMLSAVKMNANDGGNFLFENNTVLSCYSDYFSLIHTSGTLPASTVIRFNRLTGPFSDPSDGGNPHTDGIQLTGPTSPTPPWIVDIVGNGHWDGPNARGSVQGIFLSADTNPFGGRVAGNFILSRDLSIGIAAAASQNLLIAANTIARYDMARELTPITAVQILSDGTGSSGVTCLRDNITDVFSGLNGPSVALLENNFQIGVAPTGAGQLAAQTAAYQAAFASPLSKPTTIEGVVSAFAAIGGATGRGAFANTAYVNHVARTYNEALESPFFYLPDVGNLPTTPAFASSGWARINAGPPSGTVAPGAGTSVRLSNNSDGSNPTAWSTTPVAYTRGQFIQLGGTPPAGQSQQLAASVTFNGLSRTYGMTFRTQAPPYARVVFTSAVNLVTAAAPGPSSGKTGFAVIEYGGTNPTGQRNLINIQGRANISVLAGGGIRLSLLDGTAAVIGSVTMLALANIDNTVFRRLHVSWDIDQPYDTGFSAFVVNSDGTTASVRPVAAGLWPAPGASIAYNNNTVSRVVAAGGTDSVIRLGVAFFEPNRPYVDAAAVSDNFASDRIASAVADIWGAAPGTEPYILVRGNAATINGGTGGAGGTREPFTVAGGTVTDF